jgi:hypothetical protein
MYENVFQRQLSKEHKEQQDFLWVRNNMKEYVRTHFHLQGYHQQVADYVESLN